MSFLNPLRVKLRDGLVGSNVHEDICNTNGCNKHTMASYYHIWMLIWPCSKQGPRSAAVLLLETI